MRSMRMPLVTIGLILASWSPFASAGLREYIAQPDASYTFEVVDTQTLGTNSVDFVRLTSQTWHDIVWTHWLTIIRPAEVAYPGMALLLVDGGSNRETPPRVDRSEGRIMSMVAAQTKSVVAVVSQVPNEPLFGGLNEDGIIAYTYDKFLNGEGEDWPLLLPMVKSAVRAMDTVQSIAKDKYGQEIKGFVVTGGSKRGWTSWLTAASGDPRVKGIAPVVIDVLDMEKQMNHQLACYGGYSDQVEDYTRLNIQARMNTPAGRKLLSLVDPFSYHKSLTLPKLVLLGTNDPYWTVDAANFYFPALVGEKHLYYQANTAHDVNMEGVATLTQFYGSILTGKSFPDIQWQSDGKGRLEVQWKEPGGSALLWQAASPNRDFRDSVWTSTPLEGDGTASAQVAAPEKGWTAFYIEVRFTGDAGLSYGSCTTMTVLPDTLPTSGRAYDPPLPVAAATP